MIGDRIKQLRTSLNLTQQELANKDGLSFVQIGITKTIKKQLIVV